MKRNNYQWQGEKVKVTFGCCKVKENIEKPLYWYNYECLWDDYHNKDKRGEFKGAFIPAIKVKHEDYEFVISNHFGVGVHKLINGGWPNYRHYSLPLDGFIGKDSLTIDEQIMYITREFDMASFQDHEDKRSKWQKIHYPNEFKLHQEKLQYAKTFLK